MAIRKKKKESAEQFQQIDTAAAVQTASKNHPFYRIGTYIPGSSADMELYRSLREAIPIIDAAIFKIVRLLGSFEVVTENKNATIKLKRFLEEVDVGGTRNGVNAFISTFFEQLLTYGTAVGEMVIDDGQFRHLYI